MRQSQNLGPLVFDTVIRKNARLAELPDSGKSIFKSASTSFGAEDYARFAKEVLGRCGVSSPAAEGDSGRSFSEKVSSVDEGDKSEPVEKTSSLND
jgi:hypothetical protein